MTINALPLPTPADRAEWLEQRRHGLGSSDAATVVGLNPYESPYSLWEQKTGKAPLELPVDDDQAERMEWGNLLEPVVRDETARRLGLTIAKPDHGHHHRDHEWLRCNLDGWTDDGRLAEFKTTHPRNADQWDGYIPDLAEVQVHHAANVVGATHAVVACLIGGQRLVIHEVALNRNVQDMLLEAEADFWEHVQRDTPPPLDGHTSTLDALTREWAHKPEPREVVAEEVVEPWQQYLHAVADEKDAVARKKEAQARLAALMDGHGKLVTGDRVWAAAQRGQLAERRLQAEHPELYAKYLAPREVFDRDAFKADHPDVFQQFQGVSIRARGALGD